MSDVIMFLMEFSEWLQNEMDNRGLSQNKVAKMAGISQGAIAHIINGRRNPGVDVCEGIAYAFKLPPEYVFRKAGLLPPVRDRNPTDDELLYLFDQLSENEQDDILGWIRLKVEQNKKKK